MADPGRYTEEELSRRLDDFEQVWQSDSTADIDEFLQPPSVGTGKWERKELLIELIMLDLEYRWRSVDKEDVSHNETMPLRSVTTASFPAKPMLEEYVKRYPELGPLSAILTRLAAEEYRVRHRWGDRPSHHEYFGRFGKSKQLVHALEQIDTHLQARANSKQKRSIKESGTRIGRFVLLERLGEGSFGAVWKAHDEELDRHVALKIPHAGVVTPRVLDQISREARATSRLNHPNIVSVHEVVHTETNAYIVTDFIDGITLSQWLKEHWPALNTREAAKLCRQIALALSHAHEAGVVHRDLKPQNVIIDHGGEPHLTDFGLARREDSELSLTLDGQVIGTPAYMSPEQARGEGHRSDRRTDVYSLGVVLFELLTGELPFRGNARTLVHQVVHDEAPSPRKLNGGVAVDLETICLKSLEKNPGNRYVSAREMADELGRFLTGQPIRARPISAPARGWRRCGRNPTVSALAAALAIALVTGLATTTVLWIRAEGETQRATTAAAEKEVARRAAEESEQRTRSLLYTSDMAVALDAWEAGDVARVVKIIERHRPGSGQDDLRRFEWYHLWKLCQRSVNTPTIQTDRNLQIGVSPPRPWGFSPDGDIFLYRNRGLYLCDASTGKWLYTIESDDQPAAFAIMSPDGEILAVLHGNKIVSLRNARTGQLQHILGEYDNKVDCLAFTLDGLSLATGRSDHTVQIWNVASGALQRTLSGHTAEVTFLSFAPDGRRLVSGSTNGTILVWNLGEDTSMAALFREGAVDPVGLAAGGKRLVTRGDVLQLWNLDSLRLIQNLNAADGPNVNVQVSPDGRTLATWARQTIGRVCLIDAETGRQLHELSGHSAKVHEAIFSPNGQLLATSSLDEMVKLWDVANGQLRFTLTGHTNWVWPLAFSADGTTLASAGADNAIRLWSVATGQLIDTLKGHSRTIEQLAFARDGNVLASRADLTTRLWQVAGARQPDVLRGHEAPVSVIRFSPQRHVLASASRDGVIRLWDVEKGTLIRQLAGNGGIGGLAFSPDGLTLATASHKSGLELWNVERGNLFQRLEPAARLNRVDFAPDGVMIMAGSEEGKVFLWDAETHNLLRTFEAHANIVHFVAFSPLGHVFATASHDQTVKLWDVGTSDLLHVLRGHNACVPTMAFSPDGSIAATGSDDGTVKVWDVQTGEMRRTLTGHSNWVDSLAFTPDGRTLASGSVDRTIKLWDIQTGAERATLKGHVGGVLTVAMSPDGRILASAGDDRSVRLWRSHAAGSPRSRCTVKTSRERNNTGTAAVKRDIC